LRVPLAGLWQGALDAASIGKARARFDEQHIKVHGHAAAEKAVELVSYRVRVRVSVPKYRPQALAEQKPGSPTAAAVKGKRQVFFVPDAPTATTIVDRDQLVVGTTFSGPAIVEQFDATTVVPSGWTAHVDRFKNLVLER
jgi:N-methylhydantoinase A/oxoprolinase/acetone carboxylase beta subunit